MILSGLVSITFRQLSPEQLLDLMVQAGLKAIEWGGDVHVPHGDSAEAHRVGKMTTERGLTVSAYGSYYRVGHPESAVDADGKPAIFEAIVETAAALGAPKIRVWAGNQGTDKASPAYFEQVVQDSQRIAAIGQSAGIQIAYEYHGNTLTDSDDAARHLLDAVNLDATNLDPAILSYWQPRRLGTLENDLAGISAVQPWLSDVHVFSWHPKSGDRLPLAERATDWQRYLQRLNQIPGDRFALLEFVQDDEPDNFLRDAATLKRWLEE